MTRKTAVVQAAIELFAEKGFHATPTSAVAKRAKVAEGTIFYYFKTKEGILMYILEEMMEIYLQGLKDQVKRAATGLEAIEKLIRFHFRFTREKAGEVLVLLRDLPSDLMKLDSPYLEPLTARFTEIIKLMEECLERGQEDGSIRLLPVQETAFILRGMLDGLSRLMLLGPFKLPDMSSEVVDFCCRSFARGNEQSAEEGPAR